jgi:hypothetical protein
MEMKEDESILNFEFLSHLKILKTILKKSIQSLFIQLFGVSVESLKKFIFEKMVIASPFHALLTNYLNSIESFNIILKK